MRGLHRDMRGNVIGGYTADGAPVGTKRSAWRRTGGDGMADGGSRMSFADQEEAARRKSAASGAFGKDAQNLERRKALFERMKQAGSGGISSEMQREAASLGVKQAGWRRAVSSIPAAPASIAAPGAAPAPSAGWRKPMVFQAPSVAPVAAGKPKFGADVAKANVAKLGFKGAVADYRSRAGAAPKARKVVPAGSGYPDLPPPVVASAGWRKRK